MLKALNQTIRRLRFRQLLWQSRFIEALAIIGLESFPDLEPDRRFALYRLGCYRRALRGPEMPRTPRECVALAVANAACGDRHRARKILASGSRSLRLRGSFLIEAARGVAPYDLELALQLCEEIPAEKLLRCALLIAAGKGSEASLLLDTLSVGEVQKRPEAHLFRANLRRNHCDKLDDLNAFLKAHELMPLLCDGKVLNVSALRGTSEVGNVRGPLVTIIVPAFNTADRIGPALASLLAQTYRDLEVIVVDDASSDGTADVAENIAHRDRRLRVIRLDQNVGPYVARNRALETACGDFVTVHDSDDFAHPEKITRQAAPLIADDRLLFTLSDWVRLSDEGEFYARPIFPLMRQNPASPMFRREEALARAGHWDEVRTGADSAYTARLRLIAGPRRIKRVRAPLALGAHRAGSLMTDHEMGIVRGAVNEARLEYWESWTAALIEEARG